MECGGGGGGGRTGHRLVSEYLLTNTGRYCLGIAFAYPPVSEYSLTT